MEPVMTIERSIGTGPRRSTEQTCLGIAEFIGKVIDNRKYPDVSLLGRRFEHVFPLLRLLLTTRGLGRPAVTVSMPGLHIRITVSHDPEFEEDMTLPDLVLLDKLRASDVIEITIRSRERVSGRLQELPAEASSKTIRFALTQGDYDPDPRRDFPAPQADAIPRPDIIPAEKPLAGNPADDQAGDQSVNADDTAPVTNDAYIPPPNIDDTYSYYADDSTHSPDAAADDPTVFDHRR